jgi:hypothetical protein
MKVLISGCSFTQWPQYPGGPNICWPKYLHDLHPDWQIKSLAEAGAGNQYICDSVIRELSENSYDTVLVMWSGVSRLDYLTSLEDDAWEKLFDSYGFYRRLPNNKLGWIFSGGQFGTWYKNPVAHKMFYEMYKVSSRLSLANINLMEIVKLQNYLEANRINYRFTSYVNYWTTGEYISPNGDFGVYDFPELQSIINQINFNKWMFLDDQKNTIYDLALANNDFQDDKFHPGANTHRQWAELLSKDLITSVTY